MLLLVSCKTNYHIRRAAHHLSKLPPEKAEEIRTDSTARAVTFKGKIDEFKFADIPNVPLYLKGKEGIKTKYLNERDTVFLEVECPDTVVTVYDTKTVEVYKLPATYKEFIKELLDVTNFQFWLIHVAFGIAAILVVARKVFP
jgi:hypothetical protein